MRERRRICRASCNTSIASADRRAPFGSDPARRFGGVDTVSRGTTKRVGGGRAGCSRGSAPASRVRQRVEFDVADYDLTFKSQFGESEGNTHRIARARADRCRGQRGVRILRRPRMARRERRQHLHHRRHRGEIPVERGVLGLFGEGRWNATDRATITAGVRGERITRDALPGDPLAFTPRPDFPKRR